MSKYIWAAVSVIIFVAGLGTRSLFIQAPICNCPELKIPKQQAAMEVNTMDISELRKLKIKGGFTYSPSFHADEIVIVQSNVDSTIKR